MALAVRSAQMLPMQKNDEEKRLRKHLMNYLIVTCVFARSGPDTLASPSSVRSGSSPAGDLLGAHGVAVDVDLEGEQDASLAVVRRQLGTAPGGSQQLAEQHLRAATPGSHFK